jgi:hypothetical protein
MEFWRKEAQQTQPDKNSDVYNTFSIKIHVVTSLFSIAYDVKRRCVFAWTLPLSNWGSFTTAPGSEC